MSWVEKDRKINNRGGWGGDDYSGLESGKGKFFPKNYNLTNLVEI